MTRSCSAFEVEFDKAPAIDFWSEEFPMELDARLIDPAA